MTAPIAYGGPESARPFAFRWYDKDRIVRGPLAKRYTGWAAAEARAILEGQRSLADRALASGLDPQPRSGRQECLESLVNRYV